VKDAESSTLLDPDQIYALGAIDLSKKAAGWAGRSPLPRLRRDFPQRGKIYNAQIFPFWGKWREATKGPCLA